MISELFFAMGKRLLAEPDIEKLLSIALDSAIELSGAERGLVILFKDNNSFHFQSARNLENKDIEKPEFEVSRTVIENVKVSGEPMCMQNALENPSFSNRGSVIRLKILSVICVPLKKDDHIFGVLYLDNRTVRGVFEHDICHLMTHQFSDFISLAVLKALERQDLCARLSDLEGELRGKYMFESIIGHDAQMIQVLKLVAQVADTSVPVMIIGESGTGKELIARALHYNSRRKNKPFIAINCAALPENLLESEFFGHTRGAFTGAVADKAGWFEMAHGGSIFLDEISELPPHLQVKLLRVLQTGEYSRIGLPEIKHCDVRIISAASRDLRELIEKDKFREEFYYRLNVIEIMLPALRDRKNDIPLLTDFFIKMYGEKYGKSNLTLSRQAEDTLLAYPFPGNIRELENIIQRAVVLCDGRTILPQYLPILNNRLDQQNDKNGFQPFKEAKQSAVEFFEQKYIAECLRTCRGNITQAARLAKIDIKNFYTKMKKYDINPKNYL